MHYETHEVPVKVKPIPITYGERVTVLYNGILGQNPGEEVYVHTGYGRNDNWRMVKDIKMEKTRSGWEASFTVTDDSRLNMCFKDNHNRWDNNYGKNWSFEVHNGELGI